MDVVSDWIESFLAQIEQRSLRAIEREGYALAEVESAPMGPALTLVHKVASDIVKHRLRGKAVQARSAYVSCGLVRQSSRAGKHDMAVLAALRAVNELWAAESGNALSENGRKGAVARLVRNPQQAAKQIAKTEAQGLWHERHAGKHPKLRTNEQFATEVLRRWPVLISSKVICGWCTNWNKEAKKTPAS